MGNIGEVLHSLRIPKLFREVIALVGGAIFLFLLCELKLKYGSYSLDLPLTEFQSSIFLFLSCYVIGKMVLSTSFLASAFFNIIDIIVYIKPAQTTSQKNSFKTVIVDIRKYLSYRSRWDETWRERDKEIDHTITIGEYHKAFAEHPNFEEAVERDFQSGLFLWFFFSYSVLGIVFLIQPSLWCLAWFACVFFIVRWYLVNRSIYFACMELQLAIVKNSRKERASKGT